jgi:hypothetical protein
MNHGSFDEKQNDKWDFITTIHAGLLQKVQQKVEKLST